MCVRDARTPSRTPAHALARAREFHSSPARKNPRNSKTFSYIRHLLLLYADWYTIRT